MKRSTAFRMRLTPDESADLKKRADSVGLTESEFVRRAVLRSKLRVAREDVELLRQIARIGTNLNQLARWANAYKDAGEAVQIVSRLMCVERALLSLRRRG